MSLGSPADPGNDEVHVLIQKLTDQGKIVVCAAGNDGGQVNYPAKYNESIAVAAIDKTAHLAKFSSRGPELDTAAPGVQIYSTWSNNQYIMLDGTSMACPCISGIIALIVSWYKKNPDPSFTINAASITKLLFDLGGDEGQHIIEAGSYDIGVPKFCNFPKWINNV
jgi:subtilisin family serine protease